MPPAATKKDLARTPGSQASQPEKDQYHTVSLPGGSSKFSHINSLRKETPTHTENPVGFLTDKPQRALHQESGSSQAHSHTDTYKTNLHEDLQERTRHPAHTSPFIKDFGTRLTVYSPCPESAIHLPGDNVHANEPSSLSLPCPDALLYLGSSVIIPE